MLTRYLTDRWLVDEVRGHLERIGGSAVVDPAIPNATVNDAIWKSLRAEGIEATDAANVSDADILKVNPASEERFLLGAKIAFLKRVLSEYRSKADLQSLDGRISLQKRADGLATDLKDLATEYLLIPSLGGSSLAVVELLPGDCIPDATLRSCQPFLVPNGTRNCW